MRKKHIIRNLILTAVLLAALVCLVVFVLIPIYTEKEVTFGEDPVVHGYSGDGKPIVMENDLLKFEMDGATTQFSVTDKRSGKVWYSNPKDRDKDPIALSANKEELSSTFDVTYTTSDGEVTLNNAAYCQENQTFALTAQEDGSIRVDYAIGRIEKEFLLPNFITKERFTELTGKMSKSTKKKLSSNYTLIEPEKLNKVKDLDTVKAQCPSVETTAVYMLKSDTTTNNKKKIEGYFAEAGYTAEDLAIDRELEAEKRDNNGPVFNAAVIYRLDGADLVVEVPYTELRCEGDTPLTYISVLPMFGAVGANDDGWLMIPEGGGALIRCNNGKLSQNSYYANLYGWDYATERTEAVSETRNAFPVFGVSQEDGSFICIMEGATAYSGVFADIAGRFNSYNYVYGKHNVLHYDKFNVSSRTAQLLYMYEQQIPDDTLVQRYRFVEGGSRVDMANAYGDYLRAQAEESRASGKTPVNVELVGAINKVVQRVGVPVDVPVAVTTFDQAGDILDELSENGIQNLTLRLTGWCNGGVRQKVLTGIHTLWELGGDEKLKALSDKAKAKNVNLALDGISCFAYDSGLLEGFLPFTNAARFTTREQAVLYNYDIVTYHQSEWQDSYYLVRPDFAKQCASNLIAGAKERGAAAVAFRDVGHLLSADYYNRNTVTREQVLRMNTETLREAGEKGMKVVIKGGNDYAVPYADLITDMDLTGNAYALIDQRIPFYQIALHGWRDYTGDAINLSGDYQTTLLACAEYGAGLNFTFMKEDTMVLQDTQYSCYTSAAYDRWKEQLLPAIIRYQTETDGLNRQRITDYERPDRFSSITTYEDGTRVLVNYSTEEREIGGTIVAARDYLVERGKDE